VECIGACCWAPAIQVNYDFHDELAPEHVPGILSGYRGRAQAAIPGDGSASLEWKAEGSPNHA
ncbi:MAG: NAD(P)H-dependent oxidoreductase subunit E, partial [Terracidiphilus sp.]|nr:NAD(P)H-dependent oxidoreductase subunit E [Terracidiphilus sp.]